MTVPPNHAVASERNGDEVNSPDVVRQLDMLLDVALSRDHQPAELTPVERVIRRRPAATCPDLDFDEHQCLAVQSDKVKLATSDAPVAVKDPVAGSFEPSRDERLTGPARIRRPTHAPTVPRWARTTCDGIC